MRNSPVYRFAARCLVAGLISVPGFSQQDSAPAVIRAGTRLVEVEVVVRDKGGPVTGLKRDDFTVLDQGKRQKIAVFTAPLPAATIVRSSLPPGTISNRAGQPSGGATVLLFDQLNTYLENLPYGRDALVKWLDAASDGERIAIYMLGKDLTVMQDFTQDRAALATSIGNWKPAAGYLQRRDTSQMHGYERQDYTGDDPEVVAARAANTMQAVGKVVRHLAGMPGRKNLIWFSDLPTAPMAPLMTMANIHLYPVFVRGVGTSGVVAWLSGGSQGGTATMPGGNEIVNQRDNRTVAAATGGVSFNDSLDLATAIHTAVEDAANTYLLGFYPAEETLDNKFHALTVKVKGKGTHPFEIRARTGYFASRQGTRAPALASVAAVLNNPLDATALGVTAHPIATDGKYRIEFIVDLQDVYFTMENGRHVGALAFSFADAGSHEAETSTYHLSFNDAEFAVALKTGLKVTRALEKPATLRFVARDVTTGSVGSLWIPPPSNKPH